MATTVLCWHRFFYLARWKFEPAVAVQHGAPAPFSANSFFQRQRVLFGALSPVFFCNGDVILRLPVDFPLTLLIDLTDVFFPVIFFVFFAWKYCSYFFLGHISLVSYCCSSFSLYCRPGNIDPTGRVRECT